MTPQHLAAPAPTPPEPTALQPAAPGRAARAGRRPPGPRRGHVALPALGAGVLLACSVPPLGWWPLGIVGLALLGHLLAGRPWKARATAGFAAGIGLYAITLYWLVQFNAAGAGALIALEAFFLMLAAVLTPPGRGRPLAWPAAIVLGNAARGAVPFGGLPMGGIDLGQAAGPLAPTARLGGALLLAALVAIAGLALEASATLAVRGLRQSRRSQHRRHRRHRQRVGARSSTPALVCTLVAATVLTVALPALGAARPDGRVVGELRTAVVQGGGRRGLRAINNPPILVYNAQVAATATVEPPVDLVLWPEDVVALDGPVGGSAADLQLSAEASRLGATVVAGITEPAGDAHYFNAAVAWAPHAGIVARYDKVHRVPFGEYVPGRSLIAHFVNLDNVPRDAIPGHGSGLLRTPAGPMGVVISFEVFFANRARSAIRAGGQVLLVPTNTASYTTSQIPDSEIATAKLRAWETGREVVMAAPTGFSGVIGPRGQLRARSGLGRPAVLQAVVARRTGSTPYLHYGDGPPLGLAVLFILMAWALSTLDRRRGASGATPVDPLLDQPVNTSNP